MILSWLRSLIIVGLVRQNRQGIKVARWMEEKLKNLGIMLSIL